MSILQLALKNLSGSAFRSWAVFLCALLISGFAIAATMITQGAQQSLELANRRLGADIIVVPSGAQSRVETALLMGRPTNVWMGRDVVEKVAHVPGVAAVSPQLYLASLSNAACCSVSEMFMVAFDPQTDFTVTPWLKRQLGRGLNLGEVVGGQYVFTPEGDEFIRLYGYLLTLKGNLEPTGTGLDQTLFLTFETANDVARISRTRAERQLEIPENQISAALVRVQPGTDPVDVSVQIMQQLPTVTPIPSPDLFQAYRKQIQSVITVVVGMLAITLALSILLIGVIFSMAVNERRREMGVLRAIGATQRQVLVSLLTEVDLLALVGGLIGTSIAVLAVYLFRNLLVVSLGIPLMLPDPITLIVWIIGGLFIALLCVLAATVVPILRVSRLDAAVAMRE